MDVINRVKLTIPPVQPVSNTGGSIINPAIEFVGGDESRSVNSTEAAYVSNLDIADYCVGIEPKTCDSTGFLEYCADVIVVDMGKNLLVNRCINQWPSKGIVAKCMLRNVLMKEIMQVTRTVEKSVTTSLESAGLLTTSAHCSIP